MLVQSRTLLADRVFPLQRATLFDEIVLYVAQIWIAYGEVLLEWSMDIEALLIPTR